MDSYRKLNFTYEKINDLLSDVDSSKGDNNSLTARLDAIDTVISDKASISDIASAINDLDAESVGGSGKYISAIYEANGVIFATAETMDTVPTSGSTKAVTSGGVYTPISANRAALIEIVDSGAKNLSQWNAGTGSGTIGSRVPISTNGGNFIISFLSSASTGYITLGLKDANDGTVAAVQINNSGTKLQEVEIPSNVVYFNVVSSVNASYSNFMICTKAAWDISHAFQPYRPTYQELYEMVIAIQN
jgi:hypothetical protein